MKILTSDEVQAIRHGMETAARKYDECAQTMKLAREQTKASDDSGFARMQRQFEKQRAEADRLCDLLTEYDGVALHNDSDLVRSTFSPFR
jgi:hypothetical protein